MPKTTVHWPQPGETLRDLVERHHLEKWTHPSDRELSLRRLLYCWLDACRAVDLKLASGESLGLLTPGQVEIGASGETLLNWEVPAAPPNHSRSQDPPPPASDEAEDASLAHLADLVTAALAFATPELIGNESIDEADSARQAAAYGLGALLYYVLSGAAALGKPLGSAVIEHILAGDFPRPRQLNPTAPLELEAVCRQAMQTTPAERQLTPEDLILDVQRWLAQQPLQCYPGSLWRRMVRAASNHPVIMLGTTAGVTLAAAFLVVLAIVLNQERLGAERIKTRALRQRAEARLAELDSDRDLTKTRRSLYYNQIRSAQREWEVGNREMARETLAECGADYRDWEYRYLSTLFTLQDSSNPSAVVIATENGVRSFALSPDGGRAYVAVAGPAVNCWDLSSGELLSTFGASSKDLDSTAEHHGDVGPPAIALSPDGTTLVFPGVGKELLVWDVAENELKRAISVPGGEIVSLQFAADGESFIGGGADGTVAVWNAASLRCVWSQQAHPGPCKVAISADGLRAASGGQTPAVKLWTGETGEMKLELSGHAGAIECLQFSADGEWLAGGGAGGTVAVWDTESGHARRRWLAHRGAARAVAFSTDGRRLFSGGDDDSIVVWNMLAGDRVMSLRGHTAPVAALQFSTADARLVSGSEDRTLRIWDGLGKTP